MRLIRTFGLQEAVARKEYWRLKDSKGQPPGVIGWWPAHGITFVDNHDTGSTQQHWPFPSEHLAQVRTRRSLFDCRRYQV